MRMHFECDIDNNQDIKIFSIDKLDKRQNLEKPLFNYKVTQSYNKSTKEQNIEFFSYTSDSQSSNISDDENTKSDLSDATNIDDNEYIENNHLLSGKPKNPKDVYQKFLLEKYAEFMNIVIQFHVQAHLQMCL
ncbi:hypothetical protein F8M41_011993 [Gigaspora margarita]|uniref:Uncharacterized protein n=1 Tax=Gigaspora margarita TaxID=4874 RepID=A0A8H4ATA5_GIGMA|nr:hypothetical protein F8M41_011993 [Gigaspora margarita]